MNRKKSSYAAAGVDIDVKMNSLTAIKRMVKTTSTYGVLSDIGSFGGIFRSPGKDHVLVASTDGVGTKLKVAEMAGRHDTVGQDLVNHCTNDILVQGARPLFFLDYLGTSKLESKTFKEVIKGLCRACRENKCSLLGGETAEMPGLYPKGEYDLVGTIVGTVERKKIITGDKIKPGNVIIGLHCTGLQTNGFSLARKIVFEKAGLRINDIFPGTKKTVADILLDIHRSFLQPVSKVMDKVDIRGMAHITGGGFMDNIPRVLPEKCQAVIKKGTWPVPTVFTFLQKKGCVDEDEMYRVFNMGIGFVLIVTDKDAAMACEILKQSRCKHSIIGEITSGRKIVSMTNA